MTDQDQDVRALYCARTRVATIIKPDGSRLTVSNVDREQVKKLVNKYAERFGVRGHAPEILTR